MVILISPEEHLGLVKAVDSFFAGLSKGYRVNRLYMNFHPNRVEFLEYNNTSNSVLLLHSYFVSNSKVDYNYFDYISPLITNIEVHGHMTLKQSLKIAFAYAKNVYDVEIYTKRYKGYKRPDEAISLDNW